AFLQEADRLVVAVEADDPDLVAELVFGDRLSNTLRHDEIGSEDTDEVGVGGDQVGHDIEAGGGLTVGIFVGDDLQPRIFGGDLIEETFAALVERADARQAGDDGDLAFLLAGRRLYGGGETIRGNAAALDVVGGQER